MVGWHTSKCMDTDLVELTFLKAHRLRQSTKGFVFHRDEVSKYTRKRVGKLLTGLNCRARIGDVAACQDNAVVDSFFWQFEA